MTTSKSEAVEILKGLRDRYEVHHRVQITDDALASAVELSSRYITGCSLPDTAINVIDEAGATARLRTMTRPPDLKAVDEEVELVNQEMEVAVANEDFEKAAALHDRANNLKKGKLNMVREWRDISREIDGVVDEEVVAEVISRKTGIPIRRLIPSRRRFLGSVALGVAAFSIRGAFADDLSLTPAQMEGPFYPDKLPLDTDNDLIIVNDELTPAVGEITHLTGRILDTHGEPIRNALVEIWQCDSHGAYIHSRSGNRDNRDGNFQGFGRFLTGSTGEYYFRTIKPVAYPGRTPHIHYVVKLKGKKEFITQCYIKGELQNERDGVLRTMRDPKAKELLMVDFTPIPTSRAGELAARFDLVMGYTPEA